MGSAPPSPGGSAHTFPRGTEHPHPPPGAPTPSMGRGSAHAFSKIHHASASWKHLRSVVECLIETTPRKIFLSCFASRPHAMCIATL